MLPSPVAYLPALRGPHRRVSRITATDINGVVQAADVPIVDGSVRASLTNRVTRTATFTLPPEWAPEAPSDPFSAYTSVVHIRSGIALGDGTEILFPVFTGRVYQESIAPDGSADFRADDLAADVVAARFEQPMPSSRSKFATQWSEVRRLISDAVPQAVFGTSDAGAGPVPALVWDEDRGKALDDLAESAGARWYALGDGTFVLRTFSYEPAVPVREFLDGPGGLMHTATRTRTRDGSANSIVVVSERLDGSDPVRVIRRDNRPDSPTRWGGLFGKVVQVIKIQTPQTQNEAQRLADTQLTASVALTEQWTANVTPDQSIEPGDTVRVRYRGRTADQILDSVTYPLGTRAAMRITGRSTVQLEIPGA